MGTVQDWDNRLYKNSHRGHINQQQSISLEIWNIFGLKATFYELLISMMLRYFLLLSSYSKFYKPNREESRFSWWSNKYQTVLLHVFGGVYVCCMSKVMLCICICWCMCVCVCMERSKVDIMCFSPALYFSFWIRVSYWTQNSVIWRSWQGRKPQVSPCLCLTQCWGTDTHRCTWLTQGLWRFKLTLLCLHSTHLTIGAIAPDPTRPSFKFKDYAFKFSFLYQQ